MIILKRKLRHFFRALSALAGTLLYLSLLPSTSAETRFPEDAWNGVPVFPPGGLPDGEVAFVEKDGARHMAAWYGAPTARYRHGILGDAIEAGTLHVALRDGRQFSLTLPQSEVFEDRTPRLIDLDGDGQFEIVTIRSLKTAGGSVAVFGIRDGNLVELASTVPIGRSNRWLNIAGIADYAGRGTSQIAYVETPHIGGTLYFVEKRGSKLVPVASMRGFSNHEIGSREQNLSADIFWSGGERPDLAVPSDSLRTLRVVGFRDGDLQELDQKALPAKVVTRSMSPAEKHKTCARFQLENGDQFNLCAPGHTPD